jgi:uncharacterized protein (TIGR02145 family)
VVTSELRDAAGVFECGSEVVFNGYAYQTVQIGDQCWFAENVRTDAYANGDAIPELVAKSDWYNTTSGATCAYGAVEWGVDGGSYCDEVSPGLDACDEAESLAAYGRLCNWYAVDDARNLCPSGWHVPTDGEFQAMEVALGMSASEANSLGWQVTNEAQKLKADSGWPWEGAPGTNESGFAGLPGGSRLWFSDAAFNGAGESGKLVERLPPQRGACVAVFGGASRFSDESERPGLGHGVFGALHLGLSAADAPPAHHVNIRRGASGGFFSFSERRKGDENSCIANEFWFFLNKRIMKRNLLACVFTLTMSTVLHAQCAVTDNLRIAAGTMAPPFVSCGDALTYQGYGYATVQIGDQCWFAENLRSENYENGEAIPSALSNAEWSSTTSGAAAAYNENASNLDTYGRLYNWYAVGDARGLCPSGWHVPTDGEWTVMTDHLGGESIAGGHMKTTYGWSGGGNGTNSSGFSGLPGGYRDGYGYFSYAGSYGYWWSSTPYGPRAWSRYLSFSYENVGRTYQRVRRDGFSVRCVRDAE